jgi:heme/copper-type cytochrome/quinol oxidase subunit 3
MSGFIKKLFGALIQKPWEESQVKVDNFHSGQTFSTLSPQMSAVIVMFGVSTVLFSLILTGYLYSVPSDQDTMFLLKTKLLWINTFVLFFVAYVFRKITKDLKNNKILKLKKNLVQVGALSYLFLFGQIFFWY